ncbi:MAG: arabinogalactan oligomer / maltooligosaccharide transport system substrate-binding protein [Gaiellaceae bacterium]|jgi:maltose-binding protein MalE|nr:arabinogalactan oligomer / maltooligosaccharide transport system substrate-binding protein [Gaiellaceae bacterium]
MLNRQKARIGTVLLATVAVSLLVLAPGAPAARERAGATTLRIWTDKDRRADVERIANAWASSRGVSVVVVEKGFGDIRDGLKTVQPESAPDVVIGAHDWVGQLAADGSVVTINPKKAILKQFPKYTLNAFSYGGKLYGAPVAVENVGLVVNTGVAHVPKNWADLEKQALAFKAKGADNLAIAVPQAPAGDAYHMYPFFSGLGGYVFGTTKNGALSAQKIGVANKTLLKNAGLIDKWNREGLINSKVNYDVAKNAFLKGNAAFWLTGPWEADTLRTSGLKFRVVQVPKIKFRSVPFLGVQGFMVTRFAAGHDLASLAKDLVGSYMMSSSSQKALAAANNRFPANTAAGKQVNDGVLKQFGAASKGGVPMPNIPQMSSVWEELGGAWLKATKGSGATPARTAFATAAKNIATKIASG